MRGLIIPNTPRESLRVPLAAPTPCMRTFTPVVMRSCGHGQEQLLSAQLRVAAMKRLRSWLRFPSVIPMRPPETPESSSASANSRFSRLFSFSRSFSRLAWSIRRPPYCFFFSRVRLLRHTDLLDRLGNRLTSPHLDFDLSQLGDDLLGQFFFPSGMECPTLVLTRPDSLSGSGAV